MDYEKAYKEALDRAKKVNECKAEDKLPGTRICEYIFPELKEEDDDRIKKWLIAQLKIKLGDNATLNNMIFKAISWIEKQDENPFIEEIKRRKEALLDAKKGVTLSYITTISLGAKIEMLEELLTFMSKKQGDKEGPQVCNDSESEGSKVVDPKFKTGDWIIGITEGFKDKTYLVTEVNDYTYSCEDLEGRHIAYDIDDIDKNFKLWYIADAKDGDVLAVCNKPFIFKNIDANRYIYAYCGISLNNDFKVNADEESGKWTWSQDIKPASKEQRDLLFYKMKESGTSIRKN